MSFASLFTSAAAWDNRLQNYSRGYANSNEASSDLPCIFAYLLSGSRRRRCAQYATGRCQCTKTGWYPDNCGWCCGARGDGEKNSCDLESDCAVQSCIDHETGHDQCCIGLVGAGLYLENASLCKWSADRRRIARRFDHQRQRRSEAGH